MSAPFINAMVFAAVVLGLLSICLDGSAQSEEKVRKIIEENNANYIRWFNSGQVDSLLMGYSEDACLLGQGCGIPFIRSFFLSQMELYKFEELTISSISVSKSIAVEKGRYVVNLGSGIKVRGVYLTEWQRTDKNTWQIVTDISTPD